MAYYKLLIQVWCDWDPVESDLEEIGRHVELGEDAICTLREVVAVVDRPQDIENEAAMRFFGGEEKQLWGNAIRFALTLSAAFPR